MHETLLGSTILWTANVQIYKSQGYQNMHLWYSKEGRMFPPWALLLQVLCISVSCMFLWK